MAKTIGPHFIAELQAAGLVGLPFTWGEDGAIQFDPRMTQPQRDAVLAVYAAHNPATPAPTPQRDLDIADARAKAQAVVAGGLPELKAFVAALAKALL